MTDQRKARFAGVYPSGKTAWQYRITLPKDASGKRKQEVRGGYRTDEDAHFARQRRLIELGLGDDVPDDRMTVGKWLDVFLESHALNVDEHTIYNYHGRKKNIEPLFGVKLRDLTVPRVQRWIDTLARQKTPNVAKDARMLLVMALNEAIRQRLLSANVAHLTRTPRHEPAGRTVLSPEEIQRFAQEAELHHLGAAWYLMLLCQVRPGEIAGMRWRDIDFEKRRVTITATRTRDANGKWIIGEGPKRDSSRRAIALPEVCVRLLKEHRKRQHERRLKAPPGWWEDNDLVFPNTHGGVMANHVLEYQLTKLCKDADVPRLTPHSLRHTGATWARELGEDAEVIQRRLGHKHIATTLGTYSHVRQGESQATSDRLERALRKEG